MKILQDKLRLKLSIAFVPLLLALLNIGCVERVFAQGKLVVAIQPSVSSDEMLKKAQPLEKFLRDGLGGKTDVQVYVPSSFAAVVESLRFGHAQVAFMSAWPAQLAVQLGGADVALAVGADGVHLGGRALAPADVARFAPGLAIAISTHTRAEVEAASRARALGADVRFAVFGPVWDTPSKRPYGAPVGVGALRGAADVGLPLLALGGVTAARVPACLDAGATGVACIRAVLAADDPGTALRGLLDAL